jgi:SecD/SecF fusion protein
VPPGATPARPRLEVPYHATPSRAAALLFFLASGAVRGFGVTVSVGVLVSMFSALVVTRVLIDLAVWVGRGRLGPGLLGLEGGGRLAAWLAGRGPNLVAKGRWWLAGSLVALVLAGAGFPRAVVTPLLVAFEGDRRRSATKVPARPAPRPVARARSKR